MRGAAPWDLHPATAQGLRIHLPMRRALRPHCRPRSVQPCNGRGREHPSQRQSPEPFETGGERWTRYPRLGNAHANAANRPGGFALRTAMRFTFAGSMGGSATFRSPTRSALVTARLLRRATPHHPRWRAPVVRWRPAKEGEPLAPVDSVSSRTGSEGASRVAGANGSPASRRPVAKWHASRPCPFSGETSAARRSFPQARRLRWRA